MMSIQTLAKNIGAQVDGLGVGKDVLVTSMCSDTRKDCQNQLFVAIPGENFDGHDYVAAAEKAGASAVLIEKTVDTGLPQLKVDNVLKSMAHCALAWRKSVEAPLVAITGSAGKTTVKEMLGDVLSSAFGEGVITEGNLNNEIGVPLTLSRLSRAHQFAVIEMGMNHAGEIARLSQMAQPNLVLINNASAAHLEGVGTVADVAAAKGEIIQGLSEKGTLFVNLDDDFADYWIELLHSNSRVQSKKQSIVTFGMNPHADVFCSYKVKDGFMQMDVSAFDECLSINLPVLGEHNIRNALAVIAIALKMGVSKIDITQSLQSFSPPQNRTGRRQLNDSITIIDDTYNANLASMCAAIDLLKVETSLLRSAKSILVLGDVGELGGQAEKIHQQIGEYAKSNNIDELWVVGEYVENYKAGFGEKTKVFIDQSTLINDIKVYMNLLNKAQEKVFVLIKGSRFTKMENVVDALFEQFNSSVKAEGAH